MRPRIGSTLGRRGHGLVAAVSIVLAVAAIQCTKSTTLVDPSPVKCQVSLVPQSAALDAGGGAATVTISVDQECAWSASAGQDWIAITSAKSGQGSGKADFQVAPNSTSAPRHGELAVNGQKVQVDQSACSVTLAQTTQSVPAAGGPGSVPVTAPSTCPWTATSNADWITIIGSAAGNGSATVNFTVAANTGAARSGSLTIGGHPFTITQPSPPPGSCTAAISPNTQAISSDGGSGTVSVTVGPDCPWTAASSVPWIAIASGQSRTGNGTVTFTVASTSSSRTGTLLIAGQTFTVTQSVAGPPPPITCGYALTPPSPYNVAKTAGSYPVTITTTIIPPCDWTARVTTDFPSGGLSISGAGTGTGTGNAMFAVTANTGPSRSGTLTIAARLYTVIQADGCSFNLTPPSPRSVSNAAGPYTVSMGASNQACPRAASMVTSATPWLTITGGGSSGSGDGTLTFHVDANTGPSRTGTMSITGQTYTVTQDNGCTTPSIAPSSSSPGPAGGSGSTTVTAGPGCTWTAGSNAGWITGVNPTSGSGGGPVTFNVAANTASSQQRIGTLTIALQTFTVTQDGCSYSISPTSATVIAGAGSGSVSVTNAAGCTWTWNASISGSAPWITSVVPASGTGAGSVTFNFLANPPGPPGPHPRVGTITIANQTFTVTQP